VFGSILLLFLQNRVLYNGFLNLDFDILRNHTFLVLCKTKVVFSTWGLDQCRNSKLARTSTCCQIYNIHPESTRLPFHNNWDREQVEGNRLGNRILFFHRLFYRSCRAEWHKYHRTIVPYLDIFPNQQNRAGHSIVVVFRLRSIASMGTKNFQEVE
jgi:hypothetical protein